MFVALFEFTHPSIEIVLRHGEGIKSLACKPVAGKLHVAFVGACLIFLGILSLVLQLWVSVKNRKKLLDRTGDPWDGRTLEWSMPSPPPDWNFDTVPVVSSRDAFHEAKRTGATLPAADEEGPLCVPKNSVMGPCMGAAGMCIGFGAVWHIWWLAFAGLAIAVVAIIGRSFVLDTERDVSGEQGAPPT